MRDLCIAGWIESFLGRFRAVEDVYVAWRDKEAPARWKREKRQGIGTVGFQVRDVNGLKELVCCEGSSPPQMYQPHVPCSGGWRKPLSGSCPKDARESPTT